MKKIKKVAFILLILCIFINKVSALSVSKNNITVEKGGNDTIELYVNSDTEITSVEFTLVYSTYDVPASFSVGGGYTDSNPAGSVHRINLGGAKSGSILIGTIGVNVVNNPTVTGGTVNISGARGYTEGGEAVNLNAQNINVTVKEATTDEKKEDDKKEEEQEEEKKEEEKKEEKKDIDKNLLDKIESKIVTIELKKDVFEYTVNIPEDLEELDLKAIAKDDKTKIEISNQKIAEIKDKKIIITATYEDVKQEYIIKLKKNKDIEVTVDNSKFIPNGNYKSKWITVSVALVVILIVGLIIAKKK